MALGMELDYRLRWMDFDRYGRMKPAALLDLFQDVATLQAEDMGIGAAEMRSRGVMWVVVRMKYEVVRDPQPHSVAVARTWPHTPTRFSFLRDFSLRDEAGDLLVKATSEWVLMSTETRAFVSMKEHADPSWDLDDARAFPGEKLRKVASFQDCGEPALVVVPGYSDIDSNGHVNNARYAQYVVDALNPGGGAALKTFQIDYRHEVLPGVPLSLHAQADAGLARVKGVNQLGEEAFCCAIGLR